ncbi:MAG: hypothetical protein ACO1NY_11895 [Pseudorhodoplanes sp.]
MDKAPSGPGFTHLNARITQELGAFTVSIRMYCSAWEQDRAWGEEIAPSIEVAGEMISGLAARYAIPQDRITIHLVMTNARDGTRH